MYPELADSAPHGDRGRRATRCSRPPPGRAPETSKARRPRAARRRHPRPASPRQRLHAGRRRRATSWCRPAIRARSSSIPGEGKLVGQGARRDPTLTTSRFSSSPTPASAASTPAATRRSAPPVRIRACWARSSCSPAPRGVTGFFSDPLAHATMMAHVNVQVRMQAAGAPAARGAGRHLSRRSPPQVPQRRRDRVLLPAERGDRRRQPGPLPPRRRDRRRRHLHDHAVPRHRREERRLRAGRDPGAERDPRRRPCTGIRARAAPTSCPATAISPTSTRWSSTATWSSLSATASKR